jgi:glycerol-3-phosphate dehydrogenase
MSRGGDGARVVVIGGGATGLGILWDLALRGVAATLVEQGRLGSGTSGRFHGLLHSGARYAVDDPEAARQCAQENRILRRIAGGCIEPCGGVFVRLTGDDPDYAHRWRQACAAAGIGVEALDPGRLRAEEPALSPALREAYAVADAGIDSFRLLDALARGATARGARILLRRRVVAADTANGSVRALTLDGPDGPSALAADLVINAAGPWVDAVAQLFGVRAPVVLNRGSHLILAERVLGRVANRLRPPGDADILVPHDLTSILGTTAVPACDLDDPRVSPQEVALLLEGGEALIPGLSGRRMLRAFAGVRALHRPTQGEGERAASRTFAVLRHGPRDGLAGLLSVVGGKLTTYRLMAEAAVDAAMTELGRFAPCRTAAVALPGLVSHPTDRAAARLGPLQSQARRQMQATPAQGRLICECERVTAAELALRLAESPAPDLHRLRETTWFAMGPCQGTFCLPRVLARTGGDASTARGFLAERWRGQAPILFGPQAQTAAWTRSLYCAALWDAGEGSGRAR